jgi:hypothetical protein
MDSRVHLELTDDSWVQIELDPDTDGYEIMLVDVLDNLQVEWTTLNTIGGDRTSILPNVGINKFDYSIYVRSSNGEPVTLSVTRV